MKRRNCKVFYSENVIASKWIKDHAVLFFWTALEHINNFTVSSNKRKEIWGRIHYCLPYHCKAIYQWQYLARSYRWEKAAYMLDYKTAGRLYLRIFFNLSEAVCQNFSCIYNKTSKQNIILDHKTYIPLNLIHWLKSREKDIPLSSPNKKNFTLGATNNHGSRPFSKFLSNAKKMCLLLKRRWRKQKFCFLLRF